MLAPLNATAITMFRMVLARARGPNRQRAAFKATAHELQGHPGYGVTNPFRRGPEYPYTSWSFELDPKIGAGPAESIRASDRSTR